MRGGQDRTASKVRSYILDHDMIRCGDRIVAGVSGGADSVCLLLILSELREELGFALHAVHVHHGLRAAADGDEEFVTALCRRIGVPLSVTHVRADLYADEQRIGTEEAGRILRYQAFEDTLQRTASDVSAVSSAEEKVHPAAGRIATAHHMDDQAETVLFHLCRGSSLKGLTGILPVQGNRIRPLLCCTREEIEAYLTEKGQDWRTDESNAEGIYARNRLRNEILPLLNRSVNAAASRHIAQTAAELAETEEYLEEETGRLMQRYVSETEDSMSVPLNTLKALPSVMRKRLVYRCICSICGHAKDITARHVGEVLGIAGSRAGGTRSVSLPEGSSAWNAGGVLIFLREEAGFPHPGFLFPLSGSDYRIRVMDFDGDFSGIPRGEYKKWFDYDKMNRFPELRTRRAGDRIAISDTVVKKAARCMIDRKIPKPLRDRIVLAALDDQILWIPGGEVHRDYLVTDQTKRILEMEIIG